MKKYLSLLLFAILLLSCNGGQESIRKISVILPEVMEEVKVNESDCWSDDTDQAFFRVPKINFFKNERISKIIEENKDYKLTDEDRRVLARIINDYSPDVVGLDMRITSEMRKRLNENVKVTMIAYNMGIINRATTLGDLLL